MTDILHHTKKGLRKLYCVIPVMVAYTFSVCGQSPAEKYIIKDGKMLIELSKRLNDAALDSFITKFNLYDLNLKQFIKTASPDSTQKLGWELEKSSRDQLVINKLLGEFDNFDDSADKIIFTEKKTSRSEIFPAVSTNIKYGCNSFRRKFSFLVKDSLVTFFLPGNKDARKVMLAGSCNEWNPIGEPYIFGLKGYINAKKAVLTGSFNNWRKDGLPMNKTSTGWKLAYTLGAGNYRYHFNVDGKPIIRYDTVGNIAKEQVNKYLVIGANYTFRLKGFNGATSVFLAGDFNEWSPGLYKMKKDRDDWVLNVHLSKGKHIYKFMVDGDWITDPGNNHWEQNEAGSGNSVMWFDE